MQRILIGYRRILDALQQSGSQRPLLVCGGSYQALPIKEIFRPAAVFDRFTPNPIYEDVCLGVRLFHEQQCDSIVAVGGGSSIDVGKCIKLFCRLDPNRLYMEQKYVDSGVPLIAVPTTAGSGSESTRYAVVYLDGVKQSITHDSLLPTYAVLDPELLRTLPPYQKRATMLDALCQAIEAWWSVNSTEQSMALSRQAIGLIMRHWQGYLFSATDEVAAYIMQAANLAGQAINITQTTAPHAMSYKLTSIYGVPHGYAVALCLPGVWYYMWQHADRCVDPRGEAHLRRTLQEIEALVVVEGAPAGIASLQAMMRAMQLPEVRSVNVERDLDVLSRSVNPVRLKNSPVPLDEAALRALYSDVIRTTPV